MRITDRQTDTVPRSTHLAAQGIAVHPRLPRPFRDRGVFRWRSTIRAARVRRGVPLSPQLVERRREPQLLLRHTRSVPLLLLRLIQHISIAFAQLQRSDNASLSQSQRTIT